MKILVALSRFPWPLEKGDKLRAYYQLKGLSQSHEIHLVCLNEEDVSEASRQELSFCKSIRIIRLSKARVAFNLVAGIFNGLPFQVNYFRSKAMRQAISDITAREGIDVLAVQLIRLGMNIPAELSAGTYLDYMDCFSIGMQNRIGKAGVLTRWIVKLEASRLLRYERHIAHRFDELGIISQRDADGLPESIRESVHIIPNGVGDMFFEGLPDPQEKKFDLIFFGNMGYQPNVQSARYLVEEVLPEIKALGLNPSLCIAGARPAKIIQSFASDKITVTGFVDDIREYVLQSRLSIAPVIGGQGLQNKLIESMALGLPTLTTPMAFEAIDAKEEDGVLVVCADAKAFAREIKRLLEDPALGEEIGKKGKAFVEEHYRWAAMNAKLVKALELAVDGN